MKGKLPFLLIALLGIALDLGTKEIAFHYTQQNPGQKIAVIFYLHRSQGFDLLQHPQGDGRRPRRGVFALRSPLRPNPIGLTVVDLVAVEGNVVRVQGLDAINGTPVLDLKPV